LSFAHRAAGLEKEKNKLTSNAKQLEERLTRQITQNETKSDSAQVDLKKEFNSAIKELDRSVSERNKEPMDELW